MRAIILVGGQGLRLRPLTLNVPKPIVPIVNQPLLLYQIKLLKHFGITDITLSSFYLPKKLTDVLGDGRLWGVKLSYALEEFPLGTAGAAKNAYAQGKKTATFVFNGDVLTNLDLAQLIDFHKKNKAKATLALTPVEDPSAYGLVEIDEEQRIKNFLEKPSEEEITTNNISAGTYLIEPEVFNLIETGKNVSFERETFPLLLKKRLAFYGFVSENYWIDIGTPEKYLQANLDLVDRFAAWGWALDEGNQPDPARLIIIGRDAKINSKAVYRSIIGAGSKIAAGASVRDSVLWDEVIVHKNAVIKHSLIGKGCVIGEKCQLRNVVLSDGTILKAGSLLF